MYAVEGTVLSTPAVKVSTAGECLVYPVGAKPALNKPGTLFVQLITQSVKLYKVGVLSGGHEVQCSASSHWHLFVYQQHPCALDTTMHVHAYMYCQEHTCTAEIFVGRIFHPS